MPYAWVSRFRGSFTGKQELTARHLAEFDQLDHRAPADDIRLAQSFTPYDVVYLERHELRDVIRDDLSDTQIEQRVASRRIRYTRIADLLPAVVEHLDVSRDASLAYAVRRILSTCSDFAIEQPRVRRDRRQNEVRKKLKQARAAADEAANAIMSIERYAASELQAAWTAELEADDGHPRQESWPLQHSDDHFQSTVRLLQTLSAVIDYQLADLEGPWPSIRVFGPTGKFDIVECVYDFHRVCDGPPLVTTPGSDFSLLCSILYEMATGIRDESLAGAINRFYRSPDRADQDAYDAEQAADEAAIASSDNFHGIASRARQLRAEANRLRKLSQANGLSARAHQSLQKQVAVLERRALEEENQVGPFIVWSDQEPRAKREAWQRRHEETEGRMRELDLRIGTLRRLLRARGIDPNLAEASDFASTPNP